MDIIMLINIEIKRKYKWKWKLKDTPNDKLKFSFYFCMQRSMYFPDKIYPNNDLSVKHGISLYKTYLSPEKLRRKNNFVGRPPWNQKTKI